MVKSIVAFYESQEKNGHNFIFFINLRRKLSSENFCRKRQGCEEVLRLSQAARGSRVEDRRRGCFRSRPSSRSGGGDGHAAGQACVLPEAAHAFGLGGALDARDGQGEGR